MQVEVFTLQELCLLSNVRLNPKHPRVHYIGALNRVRGSVFYALRIVHYMLNRKPFAI